MRSIDAKTALCGLLGNPVGHSISPLIHNTISEELDINQAYLAFEVHNDGLEAVVKGAYAMGVRGLNVTVPHKQNVISYLSSVDSIAKEIGAVNTLVRTEDGYKGYNTDYLGFSRQLNSDNIIIKDKPVIILGAGGASRAVTYMCAIGGACKIYLLNRTIENAIRLANDVNNYLTSNGKESVVCPMTLSEYKNIPQGRYTVIQTTSKGLFPDVDGTPIEDDEFYDYIENAVDIICNPHETCFMRKAKVHGANAYNGLKMLLYQAVEAYELWNNVSVPESVCEKVYELMLLSGKK